MHVRTAGKAHTCWLMAVARSGTFQPLSFRAFAIAWVQRYARQLCLVDRFSSLTDLADLQTDSLRSFGVRTIQLMRSRVVQLSVQPGRLWLLESTQLPATSARSLAAPTPAFTVTKHNWSEVLLKRHDASTIRWEGKTYRRSSDARAADGTRSDLASVMSAQQGDPQRRKQGQTPLAFRLLFRRKATVPYARPPKGKARFQQIAAESLCFERDPHPRITSLCRTSTHQTSATHRMFFDDPFFMAAPVLYTPPLVPIIEELVCPVPTYPVLAEPILSMPVLEIPYMPRPVVYSPSLEAIDPLLLGW